MPKNTSPAIIQMPQGYYRIDPLPTEKELSAYYREKYYTSVKPQMYRTSDKEEMEMIARINRWAANDFMRLHPKQIGDGLLDIGYGPGYLLAEMSTRGVSITGVDPDPAAAKRYNPKIAQTVRPGLWHDVAESLSDKKFDWINLSHVLEHVLNPSEALTCLRTILAPGGILRVSVPNDFSAIHRAVEKHGLASKERFWVCPPDHLNYFSRESLSKTLQDEKFQIRYGHADFPIGIFLLFGRDYTNDPQLGQICHKERLKFEASLEDSELKKIYEGFFQIGLGRSIILYASADQ